MTQSPDSVLVIEPSPAWRPVDLGEVWRYRELLFFFVWRDVKVRYKQTVLGVAWAVIQPLFAMLIFAFFFGRIARLPSDGMPYPLFTYAGLLPWTFFANAVNAGSQSLIGSAHLVSKVYFPRILVPIAAVSTGLVDFFFALIMLVPLLVWQDVTPFPRALIGIPVAIAVTYILGFGISCWLSALVVRFRDLRHVIPFVVQIWMFATPIVYPLSLVPEKWRAAVGLNPMVSVVEAFRGSIFGRPLPWSGLLYALIVGVVLIVTGSIYFRRLERSFADVM
ncbi:MAG TPA: ABC transporter permease [Thermoanaerobaculia bacterium]|nr:ABC transporter permease [Thermoanaerobaculia bacterium]